MRKFKVGDTVWLHRGQRYGWTECEVLGIEKRSYRMSYPTWDPLIGFTKAEAIYKTEEEKADLIYVWDHRYKISRFVEQCDPATLRRVAEVLGYKET